MKNSAFDFENAYVTLSEKRIFSFNPPAYGFLMRNIFTGEYLIAENNRVVPIDFEQGEKLIKNNF